MTASTALTCWRTSPPRPFTSGMSGTRPDSPKRPSTGQAAPRRGPCSLGYTTAATAYGQSGERRACQLALAKAERALDRTRKDPGPRWVSYFSPAHLAGTTLRCLGDLQLYSQALRHAPDALTLASQNTRTRALHTALVALTHARAGDTDAACTWGRRLAQHAAGILRRGCQQRVHELATALSPQRASPQVNDVLHRARDRRRRRARTQAASEQGSRHRHRRLASPR